MADLTWLAIPPIVAHQFHIFREGERPVGVALWAFPPPGVEARLARAVVSPTNQLAPGEWIGGSTLWLVDLVAPFATPDNRHIEVMFGDLLTGPLKGQPFRMLRGDPKTGVGSVADVGADAGNQLVAEMAAALAAQESE